MPDTRSARQEVEATFQPAGQGSRVDLVHSGWELLGEEGMGMRAGYETGWDSFLTATRAGDPPVRRRQRGIARSVVPAMISTSGASTGRRYTAIR